MKLCEITLFYAVIGYMRSLFQVLLKGYWLTSKEVATNNAFLETFHNFQNSHFNRYYLKNGHCNGHFFLSLFYGMRDYILSAYICQNQQSTPVQRRIQNLVKHQDGAFCKNN